LSCSDSQFVLPVAPIIISFYQQKKANLVRRTQLPIFLHGLLFFFYFTTAERKSTLKADKFDLPAPFHHQLL